MPSAVLTAEVKKCILGGAGDTLRLHLGRRAGASAEPPHPSVSVELV